jgi:hypothetical protein
MTPEQLKEMVMQQFRSMGLLRCLDLEDSEFTELPTFFEVAHLSLDLTVNDPSVVCAAKSIAEQIKADLLMQQGVELEILVRTKALVS